MSTWWTLATLFSGDKNPRRVVPQGQGCPGSSSNCETKYFFVAALTAFNQSKRLVMNRSVARGNESTEQRMRCIRLAQEFRVKLACHKERMILQLDNLDQFSVRRRAAENKTGFLVLSPIGIVEFIAVTMAFIDEKCPVEMGRLGADRELTRLRTEPHRAAFVHDIFLFVQ